MSSFQSLKAFEGLVAAWIVVPRSAKATALRTCSRPEQEENASQAQVVKIRFRLKPFTSAP